MSSVAVKRPNGDVSSTSAHACSTSHAPLFGNAGIMASSSTSPPPVQEDRHSRRSDEEEGRRREAKDRSKSSAPYKRDGREEEDEYWTAESFLHSEETLQRRLTEALRDRDNQWMKHEREQIAFLQNESGAMLRGLHAEIERLSCRLREARRLQDVGPCGSEREMAALIKQRDHQVAELEAALREKEERLSEIERRVTATVERMSEQINIQADRIRQLNNELQDRTQTVAQLSSQLRAYRLKEAMNLAQQRRRVSNTSLSSPIVSPSSPHRTFPPFSTYPGNSSVSSSSSLARYPSTQQSPISPLPSPSVLPLDAPINIDDKLAKHHQRPSIMSSSLTSGSSSSSRRPRSNSSFTHSASLSGPSPSSRFDN